jgi:uncharacterized membrane protein YkvA (DUF1232 family)
MPELLTCGCASTWLVPQFALKNDMVTEEKEIVDGDSENAAELSGGLLPVSTVEVPLETAVAKSLRQQALRLQKEAYVFYFVFRNPGTPWYARLVAACAAAYLLSPVQIIPNYIPVIGMLDDLLVVFLGVKVLQRIIPTDVLTECRGRADAAEVRKRAEIRSKASVVVSAVVATIWILAAFLGSALMAAYFRR